AYERAARLAPADDARGRLLATAADAAWLDGDAARTESLLDEARLFTTDPGVVARVDRLRGHVLVRRAPVSGGPALVAAGAERAPELAGVMLAESVEGGFYAGDTPAMAAAADRAGAIVTADSSPRARFFAEMAGAMGGVAQGDGERGAGHAREAVAILEASA